MKSCCALFYLFYLYTYYYILNNYSYVADTYAIVPKTVAIFLVPARLPSCPINVQPIPLCIVVGCTMHVVADTCRALVYFNIVAWKFPTS